jgi:hypothetical protein
MFFGLSVECPCENLEVLLKGMFELSSFHLGGKTKLTEKYQAQLSSVSIRSIG